MREKSQFVQNTISHNFEYQAAVFWSVLLITYNNISTYKSTRDIGLYNITLLTWFTT